MENPTILNEILTNSPQKFNIRFDFLVYILFTLIQFFLGFIWHSPVLFGETWQEENKISPNQIESMKKDGKLTKIYMQQFFLSCLALFLHFQLLVWYNHSLSESLVFTVLLFLGFVVPTFFQAMLWEGKSLKLFGINAGYHLVWMIFFTFFVFVFEEQTDVRKHGGL